MSGHFASRVGLGLRLGAAVFAGAMLAAAPARAQETSAITNFLRGDADALPQAGAAPDAAAAAPGAVSGPAPDAADATAADTTAADTTATEDGGLDWSALNSDTASLDADVRAKPLRAPGVPPGPSGRDGTAMSVDAPSVGTFGARLDAGQDRSKLGTTFARSMPLGEELSVTLQGGYGVTQKFSAPTITGSVPAAAAAPVLDSEKLVTLNILPTGTRLGAGLTSTTTDAITHHQLTADQEVYGALHVTGTVTDLGQAAASKSITAGIKLNW